MAYQNAKVAVVIPSYKVRAHILNVIAAIPAFVDRVYVVDDCCPDKSGVLVIDEVQDQRVSVIFNPCNLGVGGAVIAGYKSAILDAMDIVIKIDGDGQMDPALITEFIDPIVTGEADYTKGNRFYDIEKLHRMPKVRLFGNAMLSLLTKMSSGYWDLFDPTNGYTAIQVQVLNKLPLHKISERYFFESDMLFRLNTIRAKVIDVAMDAQYGDEKSQLKVKQVIFEFAKKNLKNTLKRIFYNYYLRDMSIATIELTLGVPLLLFGLAFGGWHWYESSLAQGVTPTGTVMLAVLPIVLGVQLILSFLAYDIANIPVRCLHKIRVKEQKNIKI